MKDLKNLLGNIIAAIYFVCPMSLVLLMLIFMPLVFIGYVIAVRSSGFAGLNSGVPAIEVCGLLIGLSLLIPPLRRMYRKLPWLFPLVEVLFINLVIMGIAMCILNKGYEVVDTSHQAKFFILMIVELIVGRIAACMFFKFKPIKYIEKR
jgi:hypothetical protein